MSAGDPGKALIRIAGRLCSRLGYPDPGSEPAAARSALAVEGEETSGLLSLEDEALVVALRRGLARLVTAAEESGGEPESPRLVAAALDGVELYIRGELFCGNASRVPELLPGFVFLVMLPIVEQDEALELSRKTSDLIQRELGD